MSSAGSSISFARGVMKAYEDTFRPPASAAKAAARGLEMREKQPPSKRGGTAVGVSRARDLKARKALSKDTIKRMVSFFARHRDPESSSSKTRGEGPSEAKQADLLWGGSAGKRWANSVKRKLEAQGKYSDEEQATPAPPEDRIEGSDKNPRGSAKKAGGIDLGSRTEAALRGKARNHNMRMREPWQKTTKGALEAVWRRGAGAYSTSHRPGVSRAAWAMARVNAFLYLLRTGKPKDPKYKSDNDLLPRDHPRKTGRGAGGRYVEATSSLYADEDGGRWITIGAHSFEGPDGKTKKEGGTPVYIKGGKITKGPKALKGKEIGKLDRNVEGTKKEKSAGGKSEAPKIDWDDDAGTLNGVKMTESGFGVLEAVADSGVDPSEISPDNPSRAIKVGGGVDSIGDAKFNTIDGEAKMIKPPSEANPTGVVSFEGGISRLGRLSERIDIKFEGSLKDLDELLSSGYDEAKQNPLIRSQVGKVEGEMSRSWNAEQDRRRKDWDRGKGLESERKSRDVGLGKDDSSGLKSAHAELKTRVNAEIDHLAKKSNEKGERPKAPKSMSILVSDVDGGTKKVDVKPKAMSRSGQLFIHKDRIGRGWKISHAQTGVGITLKSARTLKRGLKLMDALDQSGDWDFDDIDGAFESGKITVADVGTKIRLFDYSCDAVSYADSQGGRWITIGARSKRGSDPDGPSGGARVFIKDGKVAKGPGAVKGKSLSQIDKGKPKRGMAPAAKAKIGGTKEPKGRKSKVEFAKTIRDFDAMSRKERYGKIGQLDDELSKMKKGGASQEEIATAKDRLEQLKAKNRELMESEEKDLMVDQRGIVSSGPSWLIGGRIEAPGDDATAKVREARKEGVLDVGGGYQISNDTGTIVKVPKGMKALRGAKLVGREGRKIHERVQDNAQRVESAKDKRRDADQAKRREAMAARKKKIEGIRKSIGLDKREPKGEEVKKGRLVEVKKGRLLSEAERFGRAMRQRKAKRRKARAGGGKWVAERQAKRGKRGILSRLGFADEAVIYADDENGRWVTIGAQEVDGKKKGGTPVFISKGGKITKGPKALTGRKVGELDKGEATSATKPKRLTAEDVKSEPWKFNQSQFTTVVGADAPWAGEISRRQEEAMSGRARREYEKSVGDRFGESFAVRDEWRDGVIGAFESGKISLKTKGLSKDAKSTIMKHLASKDRERASQGLADARESNKIGADTKLAKGQRVFSHMGGYGSIVKVNKKTVIFEPESGGRLKIDKRALFHRAPHELIGGKFSDDHSHYAESEGRWITIGAVEEEDAATGKTSRKGGTPVFIRNGKITKGPKSLKGKSLGKLDKDVQPKKAKANRQKAFEEAFKKIKAESEARAGKPAEKAPEPKAEAPKTEMKVRPGGKTVKGKYGPAIIKDVGGFAVKVEVNNPDGSRRSKEERDAEALRRGIEKKKRFEAKMKREMGTRAPKAKAPTPESEKPKAEAPKADAPKKNLTGAELDRFIRERSDVGKKHSERRFRRALPSDEERAKAKPKKAKKPKKERRPFEDAEDMRAVNKRLDMIAQGVKRKRAREAARRAGRKTFAAEVLRMYQEAFA